MPTKINGNRRISAASIGAALLDGTILDGASKILLSLLPSSILGGMSYQGTFNATTGYPVAASSANKGHYYVASVAGTVSGVDYEIGDWAVSNGTAYEKVDNSDKVSSVNGQVGAVVLNSGNVAEASANLYFTDARAKAAAVVNTMLGISTDTAPSVSAVNAYLGDIVSGLGSFAGLTAMAGTVDGTNKTFTIAGNYATASVSVFVGRVALAMSEYTATITANVLTVVLGAGVDAPIAGEDVLVSGTVKPNV